MKTIIAGSRYITDPAVVENAMASADWLITEIVSGKAVGVDTLGEHYAVKKGIPVKGFPADWKTHGKSAGPIRNKQMAEYADALVAVWDGKSRGTKNMIDTAMRLGLKVKVLRIDEPQLQLF